LIHENHSYTVDDRLTLLKPLGIKIDDGVYLPELYYDKNTDNKIENLLENLNLKNKFFVVIPTSRRKVRSWPLGYFIQLIDKVYYELGYTPLVVVAPNEGLVLKEIKKQAKAKFFGFSSLSIKELACLIKKSQFFIGNDSFGAHVAVSQKTKSFILVGPNSGWFPKNKNTLLLTAKLDCQPCNNWKKCPYELNSGYLKCFFSLKPIDAFNIIKLQLMANQDNSVTN
jgi:ADP-heptose:LPS heptosyltransferase